MKCKQPWTKAQHWFHLQLSFGTKLVTTYRNTAWRQRRGTHVYVMLCCTHAMSRFMFRLMKNISVPLWFLQNVLMISSHKGSALISQEMDGNQNTSNKMSCRIRFHVPPLNKLIWSCTQRRTYIAQRVTCGEKKRSCCPSKSIHTIGSMSDL